MASNLDDVKDESNLENIIDEPNFDASDYSVFSANDDEVKYHYKLKFPGTYSVPTSKILDLLDNKALFSQLQSSVKSYVHRAREVNKMGIKTNPSEIEIACGTKSKQNLNIQPKASPSTSTKAAEKLEMPVIPAELSVYDSVHSIKIPWNSHERVHLKNPKNTLYRGKKSETSQACGNILQADQGTKGIVFDRVEKSFSSFLESKLTPHSNMKERRKKRSMLLSSDCQEVNNLTKVDEN